MIKQHGKLNLKKPKFVCDYQLNKNNTAPPFSHLNKHSFLGLVGRSGSGKTSMLYSLVTNKNILKKTFENIILFMPTNSMSSMEGDLFGKNLKETNIYPELDITYLEDAYEKIEGFSADGLNSLLIIDDMGASLKNGEIQKLLKTMIWNKRHLKLSIIILVQVYNSMPMSIRKSLTDVIIFYRPSRNEIKSLAEDILEEDIDLKKTMDFSFKKKYDWLFINIENQKFYNSDFEELIF